MSDYRIVGSPPPPPRARALLFPLALEVEGSEVVARGSRRMYIVRGLLGVFALPILLGVLMLLLGVGSGVDDPDVLSYLWVALSAAALLFGLVLIVFSRALSRRSEVRFDCARGVVVKGNQQLPFDGLEVRVRRAASVLAGGFTVIELSRGPFTIAVHDRLSALHSADTATHVQYLSALVGAPVSAPPDAAIGPRKYLVPDNTAAMLCYLPVQGVHLVASLYHLFAARDRPFVRFAAKQSLTQLAFTFVALIMVGAAFGVPLAIVLETNGGGQLSPAAIVLIVLLALSLGVVAIGNLVAHIVAAIRAQSGRLWVIPWLKWILRVPSE